MKKKIRDYAHAEKQRTRAKNATKAAQVTCVCCLDEAILFYVPEAAFCGFQSRCETQRRRTTC